MKRTKAEWRQALLRARAAIPESSRRAASAAILDRVRGLACFDEARTVLGYVALGAEADPASLLSAKASSGVAVYLPSSLGGPDDEPCWSSWNGGAVADDTVRVGARSLAFPLVAIVPGVGFDERGVRLGRGRGFYDRAIADLRRTGPIQVVGLAFDCQTVRALPHDAWDQRVDFIATDTELVTIAAMPGSKREARTR